MSPTATHAVLRRGEVERVVIEVERVAVHHVRVDDHTVVAGAGGESFDHDR